MHLVDSVVLASEIEGESFISEALKSIVSVFLFHKLRYDASMDQFSPLLFFPSLHLL